MPDVRMRGFSSRTTVDAALSWLNQQTTPLPAENVSLYDAATRTLARDIVSQVNVPGFPRAMMDGYAVVADDTLGSSTYNPLTVEITGQSQPGGQPLPPIQRGQVIGINTGAPLPSGADAVLPVEKTERRDNLLDMMGEVSPGKHVSPVGEDIPLGTTVLSAGRNLRPQDIGVLSSIGVDEVPVVRQPRVHVVLTGDELLPAGTVPSGSKVADANGPMLHALVARDGGVLTGHLTIVEDNPTAILQAMQTPADVILVSGGSSVGPEDHAPVLLEEQGDLAIHGIAMRPSSPTGLGRLGNAVVVLLPGNPVSCLCAYDFFARRAICNLAGRDIDWPYRSKMLPLSRKLVSVVGRVDYARMKVVGEHVEPMAVSGASILSSTTRADGFCIVPADSEGLPEGALVQFFYYDL